MLEFLQFIATLVVPFGGFFHVKSQRVQINSHGVIQIKFKKLSKSHFQLHVKQNEKLDVNQNFSTGRKWLSELLLEYLNKKTNAHMSSEAVSSVWWKCGGEVKRETDGRRRNHPEPRASDQFESSFLSARHHAALSLVLLFFNEFITLWGVCLCQNVTFCLFCLGRAPQLGLHLLFWPFVSRGQTSKRNCCFARFLETFVPFRCEESFFSASFKSFVPWAKKKVDSRGILNEN